MKKMFFLLLITLMQCQKDQNVPNKIITAGKDSSKIEPVKIQQHIKYYQFKADTLKNFKLKGFEIYSAYKINNIKLIEGYYELIEGARPLDDDGRRTLFLNEKDQIIFRSKSVGEVYLNQPFFYKNNINSKIIVVSQLAFEYFMGAEAYLLEGNKIDYIGNIDVESKDMEISLIDILRINESDQKIIFSFNSDTLLLKPGNEDRFIKNKNNRYEYDGKSFKFK